MGGGGGGGRGRRWTRAGSGTRARRRSSGMASAPSRGSRGRNLRGLLELLRPYRLRVSAMLAALVLGTAASLAPPLLAKLAIDKGIERHDATTLVLVVIAFLVSALLVWLDDLRADLPRRLGRPARARRPAHPHLHAPAEQPIGFYESRPAGVLISRMTNDVEALESLVTDSVVTLFQAGLTLVGAIGVLLYLDWKLALMTFCVVPFVARRLDLVPARLRRRVPAHAGDDRRDHRLPAGDAVGHPRRAQLRPGAPPRGAASRSSTTDNCDANMVTVRLNAAYFPTVEMLSGVALAVIVLYGGYQAIDGHITAGTVVAFVAHPVISCSNRSSSSPSSTPPTSPAWPRSRRSSSCWTSSRRYRGPPGRTALGAIHGEVRFEDVSFAYKPDALGAASDVDLTSRRADGRAGGRNRRGQVDDRQARRALLRPHLRRVLVDGHDLREVSSRLAALADGHRARRRRSCSPARSPRTSPSGAPTPTERRSATPRPPSAPTSSSPSCPTATTPRSASAARQLSAGQRQLIAFARALIADPRILILDEATSNVDLHTEGRIEAGLRRLLAGRTAIVIAHRLSTIRQAGRIVVLEHGAHRRAGHPRRADRRRRVPLLTSCTRRLGRPAQAAA